MVRNILSKITLRPGVLRLCNAERCVVSGQLGFCHLPCMPMSSVYIKCITKYTHEVSLACECTRAVLSVLVKCVHACTYIFRRKCTRVYAKIASKSQILEKYSVIPRKKLAKARMSLRTSVKLNLSCTVYVIVIPQYEYNILVITQVQDEAEDAGNN